MLWSRCVGTIRPRRSAGQHIRSAPRGRLQFNQRLLRRAHRLAAAVAHRGNHQIHYNTALLVQIEAGAEHSSITGPALWCGRSEDRKHLAATVLWLCKHCAFPAMSHALFLGGRLSVKKLRPHFLSL